MENKENKSVTGLYMTNIDFRFILHSKVLWGYVKKFIGVDRSVPERYINSLLWIAKNCHWSLLEYKLKRDEELGDISGFSFKDLFAWFYANNGDLDTIKLLFKRYEIEFTRSDLMYNQPYTYWKKEKFQELKPKLYQLFQFIHNYILPETIFNFLSGLSVTEDKEMVDRIIGDYLKIGRTMLPFKLTTKGKSEIHKYINERYEKNFYVYASTADKTIYRDFSGYIKEGFNQSIASADLGLVQYYIDRHWDIVKGMVTVKTILMTTTSDLFEKCISIYRKANEISSDVDDIDLVSKNCNVNDIKEGLKTFYDIWGFEKKKEILRRVLSALSDREKKLVLSWCSVANIYCRISALKEVYHAVGEKFKLKRSMFPRLTLEELKEFYGTPMYPKRCGIKRYINIGIVDMLQFIISEKLKTNKYIETDPLKIRSYIVLACKHRDSEATSCVFDALPPNLDFSFLLKQMKFSKVQYLLDYGYKTEKDFIDGDNLDQYPKHILIEAAKYANLSVFKLIFNSGLGLKGKEIALDISPKTKIIEFLLENDVKPTSTNTFIFNCLVSCDPWKYDLLKRYYKQETKAYILGNGSVFRGFGLKLHSYHSKSFLPLWKLYVEFGRLPNEDDIRYTIINKDYQGYLYLTNDPSGPKLKCKQPVSTLIGLFFSNRWSYSYSQVEYDSNYMAKLLLKPYENNIPNDSFLDGVLLELTNSYPLTSYLIAKFKPVIIHFFNDKKISQLLYSKMQTGHDYRIVEILITAIFGDQWKTNQKALSMIFNTTSSDNGDLEIVLRIYSQIPPSMKFNLANRNMYSQSYTYYYTE
ncbi:hypothetical protein DLAC_01318 [Tieghemostelium lacteum]|uniref:Uncharacterized protein n=1 Tax=Tieghemostelium lacteum TaxID=361077 RepID=A0A152A8T7_TIELA|nr:hypothetical protein DLAC_01318 [Tieghemostelium lacteum]|eukprot:KYR02477.1 hypothetical protein DLAC_01318 [Tieghemostelium lacteum]